MAEGHLNHLEESSLSKAAPLPRSGSVMTNEPDLANVSVVAFDAYGTLLNFDERAFAPAMHSYLATHGISHVHGNEVWQSWIEASRAHSRAHGRDPEKALDGPEPPFFPMAQTWPRFFRTAFAQSKIHRPDPQDAFLHMFGLLARAEVYAEVHQVLETLRVNKLTLVVASNADDRHLYPALARGGIEVDYVISSEAVRSYKPRLPFFRAIAERVDRDPGEILYVGDNPYADVTGARNAGMLSYWVRRYEDESQTKLLKADPHWIYPDLRGLLMLLTVPIPSQDELPT